tara:strand:- start:10 stop:162 length:153 start_codon:yes stop_codon:yes gene_type:complete
MEQEHTYEQLVAKTREGIVGADDDEQWKIKISKLLRSGLNHTGFRGGLNS